MYWLCHYYSMKITVSEKQSRALIDQIPHPICRKAAIHRWFFEGNGIVADKSVNWLFCWGKTGMGRPAAAHQAVTVFNSIFPVTFAQYDGTVTHEHARKHRYK